MFTFSGFSGRLLSIQGVGSDQRTLQFSYKESTDSMNAGARLLSSVALNDASGATQLSWSYEYRTDNVNVINSISVRYGSTGPFFRTISFRYRFPGSTEPDANDWDLIGITDAWTPTDSAAHESGATTLNWAFRYYTSATWTAADPGYKYQIRAVIGPASCARFKRENPALDLQTQGYSAVTGYLDREYKYYSNGASSVDNRQRVQYLKLNQACGCGTGIDGTYEYDYRLDLAASGFNSYALRVKVIMPSTQAFKGEKWIWYNSSGQKIAQKITESGPTSGNRRTWCYRWEYDTLGRIIRKHSPAAILSISEGAGGGPTFGTPAPVGLVNEYEYLEFSVGNYINRSVVFKRSNNAGTSIKTYVEQYEQRTSGNRQAWFVVGQGYYPSGEPGYWTTYQNQMHAGDSLCLRERLITRPGIAYLSPSESKGNTYEYEYYTPECLLIWKKDGDGYVHHTQYDSAKRLPTRIWTDIDTQSPPPGAATVPYPPASTYDFRRAGGLPTALSAFTEMKYDSIGRLKERKHPGLRNEGSTTGATGRREVWEYRNVANGKLLTVHYQNHSSGQSPEGPASLTISDPSYGGQSVESGLAVRVTPDANIWDDWTETLAGFSSAATAGGWTFYGRTETRYDSSARPIVSAAFHIPNQANPSGYDADSDPQPLEYSTVSVSRSSYDANGRLSTTINPVGTWSGMVYDDLGRLTEAKVGTSSANLTTVERRYYDFETGTGAGNGNLVRVDIETGVAGDVNSPRKTWYVYDWRDRVTKSVVRTSYSASGSRYRNSTYTYNELDQELVTSVYDTVTTGTPPTFTPQATELRSRTELVYDSWRNVYESRTYGVVQSGVSAGTWNATKYVASRTWRDGRGNPIKSRSNGTVLRKTEVDGLGRVIRVAVGYDANDETGWAYDYADDTIIEEAVSQYDYPDSGSTRLTDHAIVQKSYLRSPTATGAGLLSSLAGSSYRLSSGQVWFDSLDRVTHQADYGNDPPASYSPTPPAYSDPVALIVKTEYDNAGRVYRVTDQEQMITEYAYDGLGRTYAISENVATPGPADVNRTRTMTYDAAGQLTTQTAASGTNSPQVTEYVYGVTAGVGDNVVSSKDLLYEIHHPDPATGQASTAAVDKEVFAYNRLGELVWRKDQNGSEHKYTRDSEGRVLEDNLAIVVSASVDTAVQYIRSTFDGLGRALDVTSWAPGGATGLNGVWYAYGQYSEVTKVTQNPSGVTPTLQPYAEYTFQYPDLGLATPVKQFRLLSTRYPDSTLYSENYTTTAAQQLSRPDGKSSASVVRFKESYEGMSRVVERELGNATGALYSRTPDSYGRIQNITLAGGAFGTTASNKTDFWYCYNKRSQATYREDKAGGGSFSEKYVYDGLARLKEWYRGLGLSGQCGVLQSTTESQTWTLDHSNNWTTAVNKANELTGSHSYDHNGNYTSAVGSFTYKYDGWNRLVSIVSSGGTNYGAFTYNGLGQLIRQQTGFPAYNNSNEYYYYGADGRLLEERGTVYGTPNTPKKEYVWGYNYLDEVVLVRQCVTNSYEYFIQDSNWNVVAITNGTASIKERYRYSAYGVPTKLTSNWALGGTIYDDIPLYTGQRYNWLNGLYNYKARYYDPSRGRFLQLDPPGAWFDPINSGNGYGYVGSSPASLTDPLGFGPGTDKLQLLAQVIKDRAPKCICAAAKSAAETFAQSGGTASLEELVSAAFWDCIAEDPFLQKVFSTTKSGLGKALRGFAKDHADDASDAAKEVRRRSGNAIKSAEERAKNCKAPKVGEGTGGGGGGGSGGGGGASRIAKSESAQWSSLKPFRGKTKTNGLSGKKRRYYEWDHTHGDIEVYDSKGKHLGTMNPTSGEMTKPAVEGRKIEI